MNANDFQSADDIDDRFAAEAKSAPPAPLGTTQLLDSMLNVSLHDFCHKFLADEVRSCTASDRAAGARLKQHVVEQSTFAKHVNHTVGGSKGGP